MDNFKKEIESIGQRLKENQKRLRRIEVAMEEHVTPKPVNSNGKTKPSRKRSDQN